MSRSRILVATLVVAILAACGGPTTPPPPPDPTVTTVSPTVAPRGDAITITGEDFGTTQGTLTIGGTPATITTWTDTQIDATIAEATPDGWQDVALTTPDGSDTFAPFFVGVEYTGVAADLQAFLDGLEKGTAVLLQAETYDLSADPDGLILDNHGLFGRGATQTTLLTPVGTGMVVLADFGEELTIADIAMEGDNIGFYHGTVAGLLGTLGADALDAGTLTPASLDDVMVERTLALPAPSVMPDVSSMAVPSQGAFGVDAAHSLEMSSVPSPSLRAITITAFAETPTVPTGSSRHREAPAITLQDVQYSEVAGGSFGVPMMVLPAIDLTLRDTTLELDNSVAYLFSARDVTLDGANVSAGMAYLLSYYGTLSVFDSVVESASDAFLGAETGLAVHASTVRALDGSIEIVGAVGALMGGSGAPTGGLIEIDGSTIDALDGDFADATNNGGLAIVTQFAPIFLTDNTRIRAHDGAEIVTLESAIGEGDITLSGNADVRMGVFKADDAVNFRPAALQIVTTGGPSLPDTITLNGTTIAVTNALLVVAGSGQSGIVNATGSNLTAGDGDDNGVIQIATGTPGWMELDGNSFESDFVIAVSASDLDGHSANLSNNTFTADGDGSSQVLIQSIGGSGTLSGNTLSATDPGDDTASTVVVMCGGVDPLTDTCTIDGNAFTSTGNGASAVLFATANLGLGFTSNQVTTETTLLTQVNDTQATFASNDIALGAASWVITGNAGTELIFDSNVVTYDSVPSYAFGLSGIGTATVTGNAFTDLGTPGANAVALAFATTTDPIAVSASGNTFSNFSRALYAGDAAAPAHGIDATIQNNVFDFTIDAAPKVADLFNVKDVIDARFNQWGANTVLATVESYVTKSGDTAVQGGDIDLDPITAP